MNPINLLQDLPSSTTEEVFETLLAGREFKVERIVSTGQTTPPGQWYDQDQDEWVLVLAGAARLRIETQDELVELTTGDALLIPAHCRHRVEWTSPAQPTVWLAIHFIANLPVLKRN